MNVGKESSFRLPLWIGVFFLACVLVLPQPGRSQTREMDLKAVLLFHCVHFVTWPDANFQDRTSPIVIGILGRDPFGESLDEAVRGESFEGRAIEVRRFEKIEDVQTCHILFISESEAPHIASILAQLKGRNVLTVTDVPDLTSRGVIVGLAMVKNKIHLEINQEASKTAGLTISSRLLRQAEIIKGAHEQP